MTSNINNLTGKVNLQFQHLDKKMFKFSKKYDRMAQELNSTKENISDIANTTQVLNSSDLRAYYENSSDMSRNI